MLEDQRRHFAGGLVLALIGEAVAPHVTLHAQVLQTRKAATGEEAAADEADAALDERLGSGRPRWRRGDGKAPGAGVLDEARCEDRLPATATQHDGLHAVE